MTPHIILVIDGPWLPTSTNVPINENKKFVNYCFNDEVNSNG